MLFGVVVVVGQCRVAFCPFSSCVVLFVTDTRHRQPRPCSAALLSISQTSDTDKIIAAATSEVTTAGASRPARRHLPHASSAVRPRGFVRLDRAVALSVVGELVVLRQPAAVPKHEQCLANDAEQQSSLWSTGGEKRMNDNNDETRKKVGADSGLRSILKVTQRRKVRPFVS